jgi:hypothetical protein
MCDPSSAMKAIGAADSAIGAYYGAKSQQTSLRGQADIADINAKMSESAAQATLLGGQREVQRSQIATAQLKGRQRASLAANGVDLGEGSALQTLTTTDVLGEVDANTLEANSVRAAWGHRVQGTNFSNQALMSRTAASSINPASAAFSSLLGNTGSVASNWSQYSKNSPASSIGGKSYGPNFNGPGGSGD